MHIKREEFQQYPYLILKGKFTISEGDVAIKKTIAGLIDEGKKHIIMDISEVKYLDSSSIGEVIAAHTSLIKNGGKLVILAKAGKALDLFTVTKLINVLDFAQDEEEAVQMLSN